MIDASRYVEAGLALIKIAPLMKGPDERGWNKPENAITDPAKAVTLSGNVGLAHAYCGRVRQGGVISAVAVGHRQAALAVMCRG